MKSHIDIEKALGRKSDRQILGDHGNSIKQRWQRLKRAVSYSDALAQLMAFVAVSLAAAAFLAFTVGVVIFFKLLGLAFWRLISWLVCACFFDGLTFTIGNRVVEGWLVIGLVLYVLHSVFGPSTYLKQVKK